MDLQELTQGLSLSRVLLLGCGLAFLLVGLGSVVLLLSADDLLARALERMEPRVEARLPAELPESARTRLAWAFEDAAAAVRHGRHDGEDLERTQELLAAAVRRPVGEPLSSEEVAELTAALEAVSGRSRD